MSKENDDMHKALIPVAAAAAGLCVGVSVAAAGQTSQTSSMSRSVNESDVQVRDSKERVEQYWTADRMRAAKTMPTARITRKDATPAVPAETPDTSE